MFFMLSTNLVDACTCGSDCIAHKYELINLSTEPTWELRTDYALQITSTFYDWMFVKKLYWLFWS